MRDLLLGEVERRMVELVEWLAPQPVEALVPQPVSHAGDRKAQRLRGRAAARAALDRPSLLERIVRALRSPGAK